MTNSGTSTERPWQLYVVMAMAAATVAVMMSRHTHPAALLLLSAAVIAAGFAGLAVHGALTGFFSRRSTAPPPSARTREVLEHDKALVLRSIKELEFDRRMGKISEADFTDLATRLRGRALALMADLELAPRPTNEAVADPDHDRAPAARACAACSTPNDPDAKFCKQCGAKL